MRIFIRNLSIFAVLLLTLVAAVGCKSKKPEVDVRAPGEDRARAVAHLKTAQRQADKKQYALAHEEFRAAIEADEGLFAAHLGFQDSFFAYFDPQIEDQARERDSMIKMYRDFARKSEGSAEFQFLYGRMLDRTGARADAAEYYRKTLKLDYKLFPAHMALADICEQVEKSPNQARVHRETGEKFQMVYELESKIEQNPLDIASHRRYQDAMLLMEDRMHEYYPPGGVMERYKSLVEQHATTGSEATFRYLYGRLLGQLGRLGEAKLQFERARDLRPKLSWPYDGLATYHLMQASIKPGEAETMVDNAIRLYKKAVERDPKQIESRVKLIQARIWMSKILVAEHDKLKRRVNEGYNLTQQKKDQIISFVVRIHDNTRNCKNEVIELVTENPESAEAYFTLATFAAQDGAFLLAEDALAQAQAVFDALPQSEAKAKMDLRKSIDSLKKEISAQISGIITGEINEVALPLPAGFLSKEAGLRLKHESPVLRVLTVNMLASLCVDIIRDEDTMPDALRVDYKNAAKNATFLVAQALDDKDDEVRLASLRALGNLMLDPFQDKVCAVLRDVKADSRLRREAAIALKKMRVKESVDVLIEGLKADDADVRKYSAEALLDIVGRMHGYNYDDPAEKRTEAVARWGKWWAENKETFEVKD